MQNVPPTGAVDRLLPPISGLAMMTLDANVQLIVEGSGEPLVMLHCLGVDHRFWDFARPLAQHFKLVRYDLPGHGAAAQKGLIQLGTLLTN
jgi:pimeloyl-ACP methyl ester carboxylesterase